MRLPGAGPTLRGSTAHLPWAWRHSLCPKPRSLNPKTGVRTVCTRNTMWTCTPCRHHDSHLPMGPALRGQHSPHESALLVATASPALPAPTAPCKAWHASVHVKRAACCGHACGWRRGACMHACPPCARCLAASAALMVWMAIVLYVRHPLCSKPCTTTRCVYGGSSGGMRQGRTLPSPAPARHKTCQRVWQPLRWRLRVRWAIGGHASRGGPALPCPGPPRGSPCI